MLSMYRRKLSVGKEDHKYATKSKTILAMQCRMMMRVDDDEGDNCTDDMTVQF